MGQLTEQQVDEIARRIVGRGAPAATPSTETRSADRSTPGLFADVDSAVKAATQAFQALDALGLAVRDKIIAAIRESMMTHAEALAREAHAETGMGRWEDKLVKNRLVTRKTPGVEALVPDAKSGDYGLMLMERAPFGVIAAITPSTNPTSTIICNTIGMVAAGNAVVFGVHPSARRVSIHNVALLNEAIMGAGGPPNLVTTLAEPSIAAAQALMTHPGIRLVVVTGGGAVVQAAMRSGKRAICAGPGNPPVVVDETADIALAGRGIVRGASFDNNVICTDEKECFVVQSVADDLLAAMKQHGAVVLTEPQARQMENAIIHERREPWTPSVMNKDLIGKNAGVLLGLIGISASDDVRLVVMDVPPQHPLVWTEQMMPVFPVVRVADADEAIDRAVKAERGHRHTAAMYSRNIDKLSRMARLCNCSIFVKNGPCYAGLGEGGEGHSSFTISSPTGEGLTGPRSFSRERRCVLVDHFRII